MNEPTKEEITEIIQNLTEEELAFALQNAKEEIGLLYKNLQTTESRTQLLISFLIVAIGYLIPMMLSKDSSAYLKDFCLLTIILYTAKVRVIIHCYFVRKFPSNIQTTSNTLHYIGFYKESEKEELLQLTQKERLITTLTESIPSVRKHLKGRIKIFNHCLRATFWLSLLFSLLLFVFTHYPVLTIANISHLHAWLW